MEKRNLHTSGAMHIDGGDYAGVHVSGSLKVSGSIRCDELHCSGSTKIDGSMDCGGEVVTSGSVKLAGASKIGSARISGSFSCEDSLQCDGKMNVSGSVKVGGGLRVGEGSFSGACSVSGAVHATALSCSGKLTVGKDVEAERFQSSGRLEIHGLLNAEQVEIYVSGGSEIADIGGGMIQTKKDRGWHGFGFSFGSGQNCLRVRTIEGDRVELEATQAAVVRGKVVRIGKDCEIDRVEYSDELILDGGSVREQVRV